MSRPIPDKSSRPFLQRLPIFYGWMVLPVASLALFMSGPGQTYSFSLFVDPIIRETGWSRSLVSGLYTAGSLTAAASIFLVGRLLDRLGARVMLFAIGTLFGFGALWMSYVSTPMQLFIGFAVMRLLGQGSLSLIPETLIALWFVRLRGRVMAINSLGSSLSFAIFPIMIFFLMGHFGWRTTWVIIAFAIWGILLLPVLLVVRKSPESINLNPDGDQDFDENIARLETQADKIEGFSLRSALKTRTFYLLLFAGSPNSLISTGLTFHQVSIVTSKGLDPTLAATLFAVIAPMSVLGHFTSGYLTDKFPNRMVLAGAHVILASAMIMAITASTPLQMVAYGVLLGFGGGIFMTTNSVIWPNYYGRRDLGSIRGIVVGAMVASAALGPWPFGLIFDATGNYNAAILLFLILPITCIIASICATPPKMINTDSQSTPGI